MTKISANEAHRWDDRADTLADAIKIALIDKTLISASFAKTDYNQLAKNITQGHNRLDKLRQAAYKR